MWTACLKAETRADVKAKDVSGDRQGLKAYPGASSICKEFVRCYIYSRNFMKTIQLFVLKPVSSNHCPQTIVKPFFIKNNCILFMKFLLN